MYIMFILFIVDVTRMMFMEMYISYRLRTNQNQNHCMSLYMDNILILENNDHMIKCTKKTLTKKFRMKT